jgi:Xaa-Pro aminopeptidase
MSFDTIVASGKNASNPHYSACNQKLSRGFLVIDCGVKVNGYCSDITRTVFLGSPTEKEKENYRKVLDVQLKCIELIKSKSPKEAELFAKKELGDYFVHSLGHGIGLDIHELPGITKNNGKNLANGVCFTIEPGMYKKGKYGIRIEDDLIKENGNVSVITGLTKALISFNTKVYK